MQEHFKNIRNDFVEHTAKQAAYYEKGAARLHETARWIDHNGEFWANGRHAGLTDMLSLYQTVEKAVEIAFYDVPEETMISQNDMPAKPSNKVPRAPAQLFHKPKANTYFRSAAQQHGQAQS